MRILVTGPRQQALLEVLGRWRHDVEHFEDGEAAWSRIESGEAPRVVVWSWETPGRSAPEICRELSSRRSELGLWLLVGLERYRHPEAVQALDAGADDVLLLPFEEVELDLRLRIARRSLTLREQLEQAREQARQDPLTGLWNREAILEFLETEVARAERRGDWLGLVLIDVDRFRAFREAQGEEAGRRWLERIARVLRTSLRTSDWVGRSGADRFQVVLPGCNPERSRRTAERMQRALDQLLADADPPISVSLGASAAKGVEVTTDELLATARSALDRAKAAGGQRLELA